MNSNTIFSFLILFTLSQESMSQLIDTQNYELYKSSLKYVNLPEGKMAYIDEGEGPAILFVHGIPTSSWMYRKLIDPLVENGFRVVIPDMLGFGASDKPENFEIYHTKRHGERLMQLMNHLKIDSWTHVLHDAGGLWSWELMLAYPAKVKHLIILNTIAFEEGFFPPIHLKRGSFKARIITNAYEYPFIGPIIVHGVLRNGTHKHKFSRETKKGYSMPIKTGSSTALRYFFTDFPNFPKLLTSVQDQIKKENIPVSVIWGRHDDILSGEKQIPLIRAHYNTSDKHIVMLEHAAHFICEEQPEEVVSYILRFKTDL